MGKGDKPALPAALELWIMDNKLDLVQHQLRLKALTDQFNHWCEERDPADVPALEIRVKDPEIRYAKIAQRYAAFIADRDPSMTEWGDIIEFERMGMEAAGMALAMSERFLEIFDQAQLDALGDAAAEANPDQFLPVGRAMATLWLFLRRMAPERLRLKLPFITLLRDEPGAVGLIRDRHGDRDVEPYQSSRQFARAG